MESILQLVAGQHQSSSTLISLLSVIFNQQIAKQHFKSNAKQESAYWSRAKDN